MATRWASSRRVGERAEARSQHHRHLERLIARDRRPQLVRGCAALAYGAGLGGRESGSTLASLAHLGFTTVTWWPTRCSMPCDRSPTPSAAAWSRPADLDDGDIPLEWDGRWWAACAWRPRSPATSTGTWASVERELGAPLARLDREDKQRAVKLLNERGAFGLRKSVEQVAEVLGRQPVHRLQLPEPSRGPGPTEPCTDLHRMTGRLGRRVAWSSWRSGATRGWLRPRWPRPAASSAPR